MPQTVPLGVQLVAKTEFFPPADVPWSTDADGGQALAEFAGRACYQSWGKPNPATATNAGYLRHILEVGHLSVLEHGTVSFYLTGVSRSLTHELIRHRHFSYCLSGDTEVYLDRPNRGDGGERQPSQTRTLAELWEMWQDGRRTHVETMTIRTVSDTGHVVHGRVRSVAQSGVKPVHRVTTANGYSIKSSADHLFWRPDGSWDRLGDLAVGDEIVSNGQSVLRDREWVRAKVTEGLSTADIAQLAGAAEVTVREWRRVHGCPGAVWNVGKAYELGPWSDEQRAHLAERIRECRMCGALDLPTELDHIDGNAQNNDSANIQPLCRPCRQAKTHGTPPMKTYPTRIVSIEYVGEEMTYDIEMDGPYKRFVANGFVVHNSQLSQRYVPERNAAMVEPEVIAEDPELHAMFTEAAAASVTAYEELLAGLERRFADIPNATLRRKQARQAARSVLPNATETRIVVTGNYRAWRHFIAMRATEHADVEIRALAIECLRRLQAAVPNVFRDFEIATLDDGTEIASSPFVTEG
jgi:thymidylate synthase ThyX